MTDPSTKTPEEITARTVIERIVAADGVVGGRVLAAAALMTYVEKRIREAFAEQKAKPAEPTKLEQVARAMFAEYKRPFGGDAPWEMILPEKQDEYRRLARAVIEALKIGPSGELLPALGMGLVSHEKFNAVLDSILSEGKTE